MLSNVADVTLAMLDIDHFKDYNDRYGHPAGNILLREAATACPNSVKLGWLSCRFETRRAHGWIFLTDKPRSSHAIRVIVTGAVQGVGFREATRRRACELGLMGWVRNEDDRTLVVHEEGSSHAIEALIAFLREGPPGSVVADVSVEEVRVEGHEQFAIRGVSAGAFVVQQHAATSRHFDLRLQVAGTMRSWAVPKGPSLDPSVKRLAVQVPDHEISYNAFEGPTDHGAVVMWDRGTYEHGGRVPWPDALERGHAVFVLHGTKLQGGFALQRTGVGGSRSKPQWLLLKRRDEHARPGSDIVAEQPTSVLSGRTLEELLRGKK